MKLTEEQDNVLKSEVKDLVVSASAGSGKTFVVIEKLIGLICDKQVPVEKLLVLTFTKAASNEMKARLYNAILEKKASPFLIEQIDSIPLSDISTIDSFCEKIIKRNINKFDIDENFTILDEKSAKNLKKLAFNRSYQYFSLNEIEDFERIYFAFKRNKSLIEECIFSIQEYISSTKEQELLLDCFENNIEEYDKKAQEFLKEKVQQGFALAKGCLSFINPSSLSKNEEKILNSFYTFLNQDFSKNIFDLSLDINALLPLPALRGKIDEENKKIFNQAKDALKEALNICQNYVFVPSDALSQAKEGSLVKALINFYKYYLKLYNGLKSKRDGLDFADIEFYAKKLLEDDEVKSSLQEKYDYIFIDEYQDTNRLQQSILKPISEGGFFVAVGDLKQGIYGFRNARMEIMQEDINNFSKSENGDALYLTGNFRTDNNILEFVNVVFKKVMTLDSVGIDYEETSTLKGLRHFKEAKMPNVRVDIISSTKEKKEKEEEQENESCIYSVENDIIKDDKKFKNEILAIQNRIEEALLSEIYDAKLEKYRKVNYSDITLLFRNRSALMHQTYKHLIKKGFPVNADIKQTLLDDGEIGVIYSLLKLTLNIHDDISLASVMLSYFGGLSLERLAQIRLKEKELGLEKAPFYQLFELSEDEDVKKIKVLIEDFKFNIQIFGINKALNMLFNKYDYYNYIYSLPDGRTKIGNINSLFKLIRSANIDNNISAVISQLENVNENNSGSGGNAINMTTIHATKGLEYPIVILCEAGESLSKAYNKGFVISEDFGLASYLVDFENMIRISSPAFIAGKLEKADREFIDEIMIFYVAMTRAQNHLFIIGSGKEKDFSFDNLKNQNSYLKMIMFALGENLTSQIFSQEQLIQGKWEFNVFDEFEEKEFNIKHFEKTEEKFKNEIEEYNNYIYPYKTISKLSYKNSVTGAMKLNEQEELIPLKEEQKENNNSSIIAIDRGNAFHEALKLLDFNKINDLTTLENQLNEIKNDLTEGYFKLLNKEILLKNILIIKELTNGATLYKEKEFIMQSSLKELGYNYENFSDEQLNEKVFVQGVVDLFAVSDEVVLIDYKFSSLNESQLKQRYSKQIELYSSALEKAFSKKIKERYLLSLKDAKLIVL